MLKFENTEVLGWEHAIRGMRNPLNSWAKSDSNPCGFVGRDKDCDGCCNNIEGVGKPSNCFDVGPNDLNLMNRLRNAGTDHRKFMRMITVYVDITGPLYWWKEFDTYKVGTVANSCSTMHKIADKEFTLEDFSCEHLMEDEAFAFPLGGGWRGLNSLEILKCTIEGLNNARKRYLETKSKPMKDEKARQELMKRYWWQMIQLLPSSYNQKRTVMLNYEVLANIAKEGSRRHHKLDEWRIDFMNWIKTLPYSELIMGPVPQRSDEEIMNKQAMTDEKEWPSTPEEIKQAFEQWQEIVRKIQNEGIKSLDDLKKELRIVSPSGNIPKIAGVWLMPDGTFEPRFTKDSEEN